MFDNSSLEYLQQAILQTQKRIENFRFDPNQSGANNARELSRLKFWLQQQKDALDRRRNGIASELSTDALLVDEHTLSSPYRGLTTPVAEHHERLILERPYVWLSRTLHKPLSEILQVPPLQPLWEALASRLSLVSAPSTTRTLEMTLYDNQFEALRTINGRSAQRPYTHGPFGHRATVLLDFDPDTKDSTPYMVIAPAPAIEYLSYKLPLDLRTLPSDPVWHLLSHILRGSVDIWPLTLKPYNPPVIGERKATSPAVIQAVASAIQAVQAIVQIPFALPAIDERLISHHAPAWEYQIPTAPSLLQNPTAINALARHNQERVRFSRERRDKRGSIFGSRIQIGTQPRQNHIPGDPVKTEPTFTMVPTDELIPMQFFNEHGRRLSIHELCPTINDVMQRHPLTRSKIDLKHQIYEEMFA